jgi:uncharacterized protein Yka (UPF0111/DUF47 family)
MSDQQNVFVRRPWFFKEMVYHIEELNGDEIRKKWMVIKDCELRGDNIERRIIDELENTFITPIDREDIHNLAINIDRTIDILNSITRKIEVYHLHKLPSNVCKFADIIVAMGQLMKQVISNLKNKSEIDSVQSKMHNLENDADDLFHACMAELFKDDYSPVDIIRLKEVYEHLESVTDAVDYVGKMVRGIKVKQG